MAIIAEVKSTVKAHPHTLLMEGSLITTGECSIIDGVSSACSGLLKLHALDICRHISAADGDTQMPVRISFRFLCACEFPVSVREKDIDLYYRNLYCILYSIEFSDLNVGKY